MKYMNTITSNKWHVVKNVKLFVTLRNISKSVYIFTSKKRYFWESFQCFFFLLEFYYFFMSSTLQRKNQHGNNFVYFLSNGIFQQKWFSPQNDSCPRHVERDVLRCVTTFNLDSPFRPQDNLKRLKCFRTFISVCESTSIITVIVALKHILLLFYNPD